MKITPEKASAWIGVIVFVAGIVWAYANLNNRLNDMDRKIQGISDAIGSAACNAILTRQIDAIERNRTKAREALDALSKQYDCGPKRTGDIPASWNFDFGNATMGTGDLGGRLNAVDVLLNESNASDARQ